ncbi:MAG: DUF1552 domain-containing protein [Myxococcota bacterium]|nr:DUF1552 domain-containing protein [Myxococcota bacterium]
MLIKTSRRRFLHGLGAGTLALPFVRQLHGVAQADEGVPKRLFIFFTPNGTIPGHIWPSGTETNFTFASGSIWEPLQAYKNDLVFIKGLEFYNATNHEAGMEAMLTNNGGTGTETDNYSLDQVIASHIGAATRFSSLELGVQTSAWGGSNQTRMSYAGPGVYVTPDDNPSNVYQRMFGELLVGAEEAAQRRSRRQSIVDITRSQITDLRSRLGAEERIKLDAHTESLAQLENTIHAVPQCAPSVEPNGLVTYNNDHFPDIAQTQMDLAVTALACDMTRVVSLQMSHTVGPPVFSWLGVSEGHHSLSHGADGTQAAEEYVLCERWFSEQFALLIQKLKDQPDPETGGSLFDSTLVVWAKELGDGRMHVCTDVPFVLGGGGAFAGGRYLDVGHAYHSTLLVSIAQAFGMELTTFGDPGSGTGGLEGLS